MDHYIYYILWGGICILILMVRVGKHYKNIIIMTRFKNVVSVVPILQVYSLSINIKKKKKE